MKGSSSHEVHYPDWPTGSRKRHSGQDVGEISGAATGDLFRYNLKNETELGKLARTFMDKGELVPDEVTVAMVKDRLGQEDAVNGAILDGFPRTQAQADALDKMLVQLGGRITVVPNIVVEREELVQRLVKRSQIEGRSDDTEDTIRNRMRVYEE